LRLTISTFEEAVEEFEIVNLKMALTAFGMVFKLGAYGVEVNDADLTVSAYGLSCKIPIPSYPATARQSGHKGRVVVGFTVKASGEIADASVFASSGYEDLDGASVKSIENMTCEPPKGGRGVQGKQTFDFSM
jgi:TonB family protein